MEDRVILDTSLIKALCYRIIDIIDFYELIASERCGMSK